MTECPIHAAMDGKLRSADFYARTLRCAHIGDACVHERVLVVDGAVTYRWLNHTAGDGRTRPEMIQIESGGDDATWDRLIGEMLDAEAAG